MRRIAALLLVVSVVASIAVLRHTIIRRQNGVALCKAISSGNFQSAIALLNDGADPNAHVPIEYSTGIRRLIEIFRPPTPIGDRGIPLTLLLKYPEAPLTAHAPLLQIELLRTLLDHGADPNAPVGNELPLVTAAPRHSDTRYFGLLLAHGAKIDGMCKGGSDALMLACAGQNFPIVKYLLEHGAR